MTYRTEGQFTEICENMINGNWTDAGKGCAEYGFYANDLHKAQDQAEADGTAIITDYWDFVELIEIANKYRV